MTAPAGARLAALRHGRVVAFSPARATGEVEDDHGARFGFHCVEIADGSRRIDEGARVVFSLAPTHDGDLEARQLVRC